MTCFYCNDATKETRPYGPGNAHVCFACAFETPERQAATEKALGVILDSCPGSIVIGGPNGPVPVENT